MQMVASDDVTVVIILWPCHAGSNRKSNGLVYSGFPKASAYTVFI